MTPPSPKPRPGPRGTGSGPVLLRLTVEERETLRRAAQRDAIPLATWIRSVALRAAARRARRLARLPREEAPSP